MEDHKDKKKISRIQIVSLGGTISCIAKNSIDEFYTHSSIDLTTLIASLPLSEFQLIEKRFKGFLMNINWL